MANTTNKFLNSTGLIHLISKIKAILGTKQDTLVSGTNIKTVNGQSLVGSGNVAIQIPPAPPEPLLVYMTESGGTYSLNQEVFDIEDALSNDDSLECYLVWDGNNPAVVRLRCYGYNVEETIGGHSQSCIVWSGLDNIGNRHVVKAYHDSTNDVDVVNYSVASPDGRGITSIVKTATVGLVDTYTITYSDGTTSTYTVTNGRDGQDGADGADGADGVSLGEVALVQTTGDSEESVMSQKAVTEYGRKVTTEDLNGTSEWIKAKLTEEGWEFGKELNSTGDVRNAYDFCVTGFIPMEDFYGNYISILNRTTSGKLSCWYDENKTFVKSLGINGSNSQALVDVKYKNAKYVRLTLVKSRLQETYIYNNSTQNYYYKWENYLFNILSSENVTVDCVNKVIPLETEVTKSINSIGRRAFGSTSTFNAVSHAYMCWSEKRYNTSSKPWVDVVCYNAIPSNEQRNCWFGFTPYKTSNKPSTLADYIGFVDNVWSMDFIVRRNGTTVHTTSKALNDFCGSAVAFGCRFDFRRKFVHVAWRSKSGVYTENTIDLSAYDLDLGYCYMCTTIGYCSWAADLYVAWNNKINMSDFSDFFSSPLQVGKFKKFAEFAYPDNNIDGSVVVPFTNLMTNWSATQDANGHWVASIDVSSFTAMMHNQSSVSGFLYDNWDLQIWVGKIKASNGSLQFKQRYTTIKDVYDLTDNVFLTAVDDVYTITSGHTVELRIVGHINGRAQMLSFLGTCDVEMWDWEVHVAMNTNITPTNYDGKKIFGGMNFLYDYPNAVEDLPLVSNGDYCAQGFIKYTSNKLYARVYDTSTNTYINKQISNT